MTDQPTQAEQTSAKATIQKFLADTGLQSLGALAWKQWLTTQSTDYVYEWVRQTKAYAERFPGMKMLADKGEAITEAEYIQKEQADTELMRSYGLSPRLITRQELGKLIGNQVSVNELTSRLDAYKQAVLQAPHEVRNYLQQQFGIHTGDLIGYWLNPKEALPGLQEKVAAAQIGGQGQISGFGDISTQDALRFAQQGVTASQAAAGLAQAASLKGLTQDLAGADTSTGLTSEDLLNATLGGNADAQQKVSRAQQSRLAANQAGGGFAAGQGGVSGLGSANV